MSLKVERIKKKMTQKELEEKSGVCRNVISKIENGYSDNVLLSAYKKLAKALDIPVEELIKEEEV